MKYDREGGDSKTAAVLFLPSQAFFMSSHCFFTLFLALL